MFSRETVVVEVLQIPVWCLFIRRWQHKATSDPRQKNDLRVLQLTGVSM